MIQLNQIWGGGVSGDKLGLSFPQAEIYMTTLKFPVHYTIEV